MVEQLGTGTIAQLQFANLTGEPDGSWIADLKESTSAWAAQTMPGVAEIQVALEEDTSRYAVILYRDPAQHIAAQLKVGLSPAEALVEWQDLIESLVDLHDRFGDRMVAITEPDSSEEVEALVQHIEASTYLAIVNPDSLTVTVSADSIVGADRGLYLAALQLLTLQRPQQLITRLEALSLPAPRQQLYVPDFIAEFLEHQKHHVRESAELKTLRVERKAQKNDAARLSKENALVIEQLHKTQEELERQLLQQREQRGKINQMRRGREYRKAKIAELQQQLNDLKREGAERERELESDSEQIAELQRTLQDRKQKLASLRRGRDYRKAKVSELNSALQEREQKIRWLRTEHERAKGNVQELERSCQKLQAELRRMRTSRSWKYTKVLRRLNRTER